MPSDPASEVGAQEVGAQALNHLFKVALCMLDGRYRIDTEGIPTRLAPYLPLARKSVLVRKALWRIGGLP